MLNYCVNSPCLLSVPVLGSSSRKFCLSFQRAALSLVLGGA